MFSNKAFRTTARTQAFMPDESPPLVITAILFIYFPPWFGIKNAKFCWNGWAAQSGLNQGLEKTGLAAEATPF
jgi:hypothetical protein